MFKFDQSFLSNEIKIIAGADEVGRGPLAGPVVASIVILKNDIVGLNDSKKMTEKKREELYVIIKQEALAISVVFIDEKTIDEINILNATKLAMTKCLAGLKISPDLLLIDGNFAIQTDIRQQSVIKGDGKSAVIAAASIIAKVERDRFMQQMHAKYPEYGFDSHKGYGSQTHLEAIKKYGPCAIHRKTFRPVSDFFSKQMEFGL